MCSAVTVDKTVTLRQVIYRRVDELLSGRLLKWLSEKFGRFDLKDNVGQNEATEYGIMKWSYKIAKKSGFMGGVSFIVKVGVSLGQKEQATRDEYGVVETLKLDEKFSDYKPISSIGHLELNNLLKGADISVPTIQMAADLVSQIRSELARIKQQIEATQVWAENLDVHNEEEI